MTTTTTTTATTRSTVSVMVMVVTILLTIVIAAGNAANHNASGGSEGSGSICLLVYQMADNNLEEYIRKDNYELTQSKLVKDTRVTTWIYFDARNFGQGGSGSATTGDSVIIRNPLRNIYNSDGSKIQYKNNWKYQGSRYFTYDHSMHKMIVNTTMRREQDSDHPNVLYEFLNHGILDCISKGRSQYLLILSSHGVGIAGFGHDENDVTNLDLQHTTTQPVPPDTPSSLAFTATATTANSTSNGTAGGGNRRFLQQNSNLQQQQQAPLRIDSLQQNTQIVQAIQAALVDVAFEVTDTASSVYVPTTFDIVGFDACLMNSFETLDDYSAVAKYFLASETIEPGHGWAYNKLRLSEDSSSNSIVLDVGKSIINSFIDETQNPDNKRNHLVPKTLSLIDTSKWYTFVKKFEQFSYEMNLLIRSRNESIFVESITRSRSEAIAISGGLLDRTNVQTNNVKYPNSIDIGDFLLKFQNICNPSNKTFAKLLQQTINSYNDMYVLYRNGDGTPKQYTGMSMFWPKKDIYMIHRTNFESNVFNNTHPFFSHHAPNFMKFLHSYYTTLPPVSPGKTCSCTTKPKNVKIQRDDLSEDEVNEDDVLLLNPKLRDLNDGLEVSSQISSSTDYVYVEYGVDVSAYYLGTVQGNGRRHLRNSFFTRHYGTIQRRRRMEDQDEDSSTSKFMNHKRYDPRRRGAVMKHSHDKRHKRMSTMREMQRLKTSGRQLQQDKNDDGDQFDDNYLIFFGGDALVKYTCSGINAIWDRQYFFLLRPVYEGSDDLGVKTEKNGNVLEAIYAFDDGPYTKSIPVYYFPTINSTIKSLLQETFLSFDDADSLGGLYSTLQFSINPQTGLPIQNLALYSESRDTGAFAETPKSAKGYITPIVYVEGYIDDVEYNTVIGGLYGTLMEWKWGHGIKVTVNDTKEFFFDELGADTAVIDIEAWDYDRYYVSTSSEDEVASNDVEDGAEGYDFYYWLIGKDELLSEGKPSGKSGSIGTASLTYTSYLTLIAAAIVAVTECAWYDM